MEVWLWWTLRFQLLPQTKVILIVCKRHVDFFEHGKILRWAQLSWSVNLIDSLLSLFTLFAKPYICKRLESCHVSQFGGKLNERVNPSKIVKRLQDSPPSSTVHHTCNNACIYECRSKRPLLRHLTGLCCG